jgi:glycosyltransferase involved in cell wall biosynthesis
MPKVSVIIPVYGHAGYVLDSLDSVFAQSYTDFEVIVINDGSPDASESVLEPYISSGKIKYVCQENKGVAAARNHGLALASGDFVAFLDDDDIWPASKLEIQADQMENCDAVVVGGSSHGFIDIDTHNADVVSFDPHKFELLNTIDFFLGNPFTSPGQVIIRKSALDVVGGYDEAIWGVDDLDLWIRLSRIGEIRQYEYMALHYRVHDANASLNLEKMARNTELVIRKNLLLLAEEDKVKFERAGYRFLFRCAGKKLLWKGAKFIKMGRKEEGWQMIQQSISMFRPRFKLDAVLVVQFFLATLKIPFRMGRMR